jgi:hypothetical protein
MPRPQEPKKRPRPNRSDLLAHLVQTLQSRLPDDWKTRLEAEARSESSLDALLWLTAAQGETAELVVEAKSRVDPKDVAGVIDQCRRWSQGRPCLLTAPYLGPRTQELLKESGINWADYTGNLRLSLDSPAVFLEAQGASSDPWSIARPVKSLKGPAAASVVRALCDFRPPYSVTGLAARANMPASSVSRVTDLLASEALIEKKDRGKITSVNWPALLEAWTRDYSFSDSNSVTSYLEPRGLERLGEKLRATNLRYAATASLAAAQLRAAAPLRFACVFTDNPAQLAEELGLTETDVGGNVLLARPLGSFVYERTWERDGLIYAAASQVAADLLTGPGRGPSEAEPLLDWMRQNEDAWRS